MNTLHTPPISRRQVVLGAGASLAAGVLAAGTAGSATATASTPAGAQVDVLTSLRTSRAWINYGPAAPFDFQTGTHPVPEDQVRSEMQFLYDAGFRGIVTNAVTYGLEAVPRIAKEIGFDHAIAKLWWPDEETFATEKSNLAREIDHIDAIMVGNETVNKAVHRGEPADDAVNRLQQEIDAMQAVYGCPVTTGLHFIDWQQHPHIAGFGDFTFFNAQPWWVLLRNNPVAAAQWVVEAHTLIRTSLPDDRVFVLQEAAFPSGAIDSAATPGATRENQKVFYERLIESGIPFVYGFSADQEYAQTWSPPGGFGGLWDSTYQPKPVVDILDLGPYPMDSASRSR